MNEIGTTKEITNHDKPLEKERYLCISDGFMICCLDLKQREDQPNDDWSNRRPLPKISVLNLLDKGLPASTGLFKSGSHLYMIGGQEFPRFNKDHNHNRGMKLLHSLYQEHGVKGSSRKAYIMSLTNDSLSLYNQNIFTRMNKPKFWPIVEKIDDEVHVIESLPSVLNSYHPDTIPSHEVFNLKDPARGWIELSTTLDSPKDIQNHFVIGQLIYARTQGQACRDYWVFDSKECIWELHSRSEDPFHGRAIRHVADIPNFGLVWTAQEFHGEFYVVLAIVEKFYPVKETVLMAYVVNLVGNISWRQTLGAFFEGFTRPFVGVQGKLIKVDDDDEGKTMCVVLQVKTTDEHREELLFITSFTLEEVDARSAVLNSGSDHFSEDSYFLRIVVKNRYVYNTDAYLGAEGDIAKMIRLQAYFL